jgi:hypothetical protein
MFEDLTNYVVIQWETALHEQRYDPALHNPAPHYLTLNNLSLHNPALLQRGLKHSGF